MGMSVAQFSQFIWQSVRDSESRYQIVDRRIAPLGFRPDRFRCNYGLKKSQVMDPPANYFWVFALDDEALDDGVANAEAIVGRGAEA